ncbi:MAG: cytochrome d ubiquinol oxidase subunit II, partial [Myxococcales bacterium]
MPPSEVLLGGVLVLALVLYFLLGGADFGGGVWDLLATGPRRAAQRAAIEHALGPVWEPNHVWLILVIVVLFTAFPRAFAALATGLYVPLTLFLVGIVLRGSAFSFRAADHHDDEGQRRWGRIFAIASVIAPFLLGAMVATIAAGGLASGAGGATWISPFSIACGVLSLTLAAFLAATYLTVEVTEPELREDFRRRALVAGAAAGAVAGVAFLLARTQAPLIHAGLSKRPFTWPLHLVTGAAAAGALAALWWRRFQLARVLAALQVALVICGWAVSQYPFLVPPALTLWTDVAPARTRALLL